MKRIKVIENKYGIICDESTGAGCGGANGDYNKSALQNGEAVTNYGGKL